MGTGGIDQLAAVIPTTGRREIVTETLFSLAQRKTFPECAVIVGASQEDLPEQLPGLRFRQLNVVCPVKGLTFQRNLGVRCLPRSIKNVTFLDDDVEIHDDYCGEVSRVFGRHPSVAAFMGCLLANGHGIDRSGARNLLDAHQIPAEMPPFGLFARKWVGLYGCTMNIRRDIVEKEPFDERLPLYALGEDAEIGFRIRRHGLVGGSARCPIVHLAVRSGRLSEVGVGYAQIINYVYFARKGIGYPKLRCYFDKLLRTPLVNLIFGLAPQFDRQTPIDRWGRLRGNILALRDVLGGRIEPERLVNVVASKPV